MDYKDYYRILGVTKDADEQTIKSAYRRLARQFHPDVNSDSNKDTATEKFKEINEAYTVLSDPDKRRTYDSFGARYEQFQRNYTRPSGPATGTPDGQRSRQNPYTKSTGPAPGRAGSSQQNRQQTYSRTIDPEEMERIFRSFGWGATSGGSGASGRRSNADFSDFFEALFGGLWTTAGGQVVRTRDIEVEAQVTLEEVFRGTTRTLSYNDGRKVEVSIPRGADTGVKLRVQGMGQRGLFGARGDLYLTVQVLPHAVFVRQGDDLRIQIAVDYDTAMQSGQVAVRTLEKPVMLRIPAGTQTGQAFRLSGLGMPNLAAPDRRGDLYAVVTVLPKPTPKAETTPRSAPRARSKPNRRRTWSWASLRRGVSIFLMAVGFVALLAQIVIAGASAWLPLAALAVVLLAQGLMTRSALVAVGGLAALVTSIALASQGDLAPAELALQAWPLLPLEAGFVLIPRHRTARKQGRTKPR